ncbi:sarcolemmal membrane-associated protein-like isoform X2 [Sycon ciliatum]|uniref:sarcolemmal membrane-associated protein-like isoform X2 n=1 Tax=Sycon ciliatum TaxID=27933 RepID=UPI0020AA5988|eukprot:scpid37123/ scgid1811/ Sarcolemmal membrane-associated protein
MAVKIVIRPHPKSHPFAERECYVNPSEQMKVGRSVAKVKAATNNFIFDCKVLSRNHAVIWLEDGQFFIKDTKSSNGTFVNSHRLSRTGEESAPVPLRDGDIVQFGVDVTENQNRSVTHGCIITTFHCDLDVKKTGNIAQDPMVDVSARDLDELARILIETKQHQEALESKLSAVQVDINETKTETQQAYKSYLDEDELLSRIEMLENQLQFYTQDLTEECLLKQLTAETEKRHQETSKAKDNIKRVLQEKLDLSCKLSETKLECDRYQQEADRRTLLYQESQKEMSVLAEKQRQRLAEMEELRTQLNSMEERHSVLEQKSSEEHTGLNAQLTELKEKHDKLVDERDRLVGTNAAYEEHQASISGENSELQSEITTLKLKLKTASELKPDDTDKARIKELDQRLEALDEKYGDLTQQLEQSQTSNGELQQLANERLLTLDKVESEIQEKSRAIVALEGRIKQLSETPATAASPLVALPVSNGPAAVTPVHAVAAGSVGSDSSVEEIKRLPSLDDGDLDGSFVPGSASSPNGRKEGIAATRSCPDVALPQSQSVNAPNRSNHSSPAQYVAMRQNLSDSRKFISRLQHENKDMGIEQKRLKGQVEELESRLGQEQLSCQQQIGASQETCRQLQAHVDSQSLELIELRRAAADNMLRQQRELAGREEDAFNGSPSKMHPSRVVMQRSHLIVYCVSAFVVGLLLSYFLACR